MKKLQITLMIVLSSFFLTNGAIAQNKPLACQDVAAGGLRWENGRWVTSTFKTDKFILVLAGNNLTKESVGKAFGVGAVSSSQISCIDHVYLISCTSSYQQLVFDTKTLKGGISTLLGSAMEDGSYKDTVFVRAFSCQPY